MAELFTWRHAPMSSSEAWKLYSALKQWRALTAVRHPWVPLSWARSRHLRLIGER